MKFPIGTTIVFEDKVFDFRDELEIKAYVVTDAGEIKYLVHDPKSEYDCMFKIMSERELDDEIEEKEKYEDKKCYFKTKYGIRRRNERIEV